MRQTHKWNWLALTGKVSLAYGIVVVVLGYGIATCDKNAGLRMCLSPNEFGDLLAGIFAPLAFFWLAAAVLIQAQELSAQREELRLTRDEFVLQREVMARHADAALQQTEIFEDEKNERRQRSADELYEELRLAAGQAALRLKASHFSVGDGPAQIVYELNHGSEDLLQCLAVAAQRIEEAFGRSQRVTLSDASAFSAASAALQKIEELLPILSPAKQAEAERADMQKLIDVVASVREKLKTKERREGR